MNYQKNSFIFLETIVSLLIVSIIVTIFFKISYDKDSSKNFTTIQSISNKLKKSNYDNFQISDETLNIKKDSKEESIKVKKISFENENIKLVKYEYK